ncbi:MAG: hypothetical protein R2747_23820 [Pyrinomonadaceae bacterium]
MQKLNLKKIFLYLLIGSVSVSALLGILVILFGNFGELEMRVLLTTLTVTCTSILGLACGAYLETGRGRFLPTAGIALALVSAILWMIAIWTDFRGGEYFIKTVLSTTLLSASCSHLSLISIARLDRKFIWSWYAAQTAVWALTAILLWIIWIRSDVESELIGKMIGVLSIVIAALTLVTPVFHKLSRDRTGEKEIDDEISSLRRKIADLEKRKAEIHKQGSVE